MFFIAIAKADENELKAIGNIFAKNGSVKVGSVKSNMGNSEPASGVCAVTKVHNNLSLLLFNYRYSKFRHGVVLLLVS